MSNDNDTGWCIDGIVDRPVFHNGDNNRVLSDICIPLEQHVDCYGTGQRNNYGVSMEVDHNDVVREEAGQAAAQKTEKLPM